MSKFNKSGLTLNRIFIIFIISTFLSFSFEQNATNTTNETTTVNTTTPENATTPENTTINTTIPDTSNKTEETDGNSTHTESNIRAKKSGGLSVGGIIGIVVPCVAAVGGLGAAYALTRGKGPAVNQNVAQANFESSMSKFNTQPNNIQTQVQPPVKEVEVIQTSPIVEQHPIYPVKQEAPKINNNIIPQQIDTVQPITSTNISVPTHNAMASQSQLMQNDNAIKIINNSQQIIPQNNVSQANPSTQVIPIMD